MEEKAHFVLVHGACHGAWCWYKLVTLLRSAGHTVTALDLSASGIDAKNVQDLRSISEYLEPLMMFMESLPTCMKEKVILVAHSYGGFGISKAMEIYPGKISVAVFVAALMPGPAFSTSTLMQENRRRQSSPMDSQVTYKKGAENQPATFIFGPSLMSAKLYQLCPPEDLTLATMLVRPLPIFSDEDTLEEILLTNKSYGLIRRVYIVCDEDKIMEKDFQLWMIENNRPDEVKQSVKLWKIAFLILFICLFVFLGELSFQISGRT